MIKLKQSTIKKIFTYWQINTVKEEYFVNEQGNKHGEYKMYYTNGKLYKKCRYVNGILHGNYKTWYYDGTPWSTGKLVNGELHGEYKTWYSDGTPKESFNYVNGKRDNV